MKRVSVRRLSVRTAPSRTLLRSSGVPPTAPPGGGGIFRVRQSTPRAIHGTNCVAFLVGQKPQAPVGDRDVVFHVEKHGACAGFEQDGQQVAMDGFGDD